MPPPVDSGKNPRRLAMIAAMAVALVAGLGGCASQSGFDELMLGNVDPQGRYPDLFEERPASTNAIMPPSERAAVTDELQALANAQSAGSAPDAQAARTTDELLRLARTHEKAALERIEKR